MKRIVFFLFVMVLSGGVNLSAVWSQPETTDRLSETHYKALKAVHQQIEAGHVTVAIHLLDELLPLVKEEPYAASVVYQTYGYAYINVEDYQHAISSFQAALSLNRLPEKTTRQIQYDLAQLNISLERYEVGVKGLEDWMKEVASPPAEAHELAASAYVMLENKSEAIAHLLRAMAVTPTPKESWYQTLLTLYIELDQNQKAADLLESMVLRFPEQPRYWTHLSSLYRDLDQQAKALAVLELAHKKNLLQGRESLYLAHLYLDQGIPQKTGRLLEEMLEKGNLVDEGQTYLLLGIARHEVGNKKGAIESFERALIYDSSKDSATEWLASIEPSGSYTEKMRVAGSMLQ
ncbi:MAG: tetratricopeptide repeat protein [Nitrospiria bacterium]